MTQFKTAGFKETFVEGCWNVHPPFSETLWKLSSSGAAVYDSKALDCRSLADSLRMKSPPEEGRGQQGAGEGAAAPGSWLPEAGASLRPPAT